MHIPIGILVVAIRIALGNSVNIKILIHVFLTHCFPSEIDFRFFSKPWPYVQRFVVLVLLFFCITAQAQKTDKVFLKNGDELTGEIKRMKFAKLTFDMTGPGIISIKWEEITKLRSDKVFQITMRDGALIVTKLDSVFFTLPDASLENIIEMVQIEGKFLKRLEGDVNLGFSYTKSSDITQFNLAGTVLYRVPKIESSLKVNSIISRSSDDTITSKKQDAYVGLLRKLPHRHLISSALGWERNTELGLASRYLIGAGWGKILYNDNTQRFLSVIGLSYNQEQSDKGNDYRGNLEILGDLEYKKFRYSSPKISITAQYKIFPSLSDWGRIRMNLNLNTSIEIFKDFLVGITFYDNYDNKPSAEAASNNDFGATFTIGYQFGK